MSWPTIFNAETCRKRGLCPVTKVRGQSSPLESHTLYYERHGREDGPKVLLIMGLNSSMFAWGKQVELLAKDHNVLVFDHRGVGNSSTPLGPYSTRGLAEDVLVLLDYVEWTGDARDIHIVGISLGGMVAQELSTRIHHRIKSLTLSVTTPGGPPWMNWPPWKGFTTLTRLVFEKDPARKVAMILGMSFPSLWLNQVDSNDKQLRTNREIQTKDYLRRIEVTRPQKLMGHLSQMLAALTHWMSAARLKLIADNIPNIAIVTGDEDNLVKPSNSLRLKKYMPKARLVLWSGTGHALHTQWPRRYYELLLSTFNDSSAEA